VKRIAVRLYLSFHWSDFPETLHLAKSTHALQFDRPIINPFSAKLNPICHLLALLGAHHILHVSRVRVKGTFLGEQRVFSYLSRLLLVRFPDIYLTLLTHAPQEILDLPILVN
jgi:hypothetical protein